MVTIPIVQIRPNHLCEQCKRQIRIDDFVRALGLSRRISASFFDMGLVVIDDLLIKTEKDLLRHQWIGRKSLGEIKEALDVLGLKLKD